MGKTLVIAEKTQAAKALMAGLPTNFKSYSFKLKSSESIPAYYYESEDIVVVAAAGHLLRLYDIEEYLGLPEKTKWTLDNLPYVPDNFLIKPMSPTEYGANPETKVELIRQLLNRKDVTRVVNFGDPDNEGELLVREILSYLNNTKPVKRLICKTIVPDAVAEAYHNLHNENEFNFMYFEALARQQIDWLLGINYSRFLSLKTRQKFFIGRVLAPIVKYVYDRDKAIENFKSQKSYGINSTFTKDKKEFLVTTSKPEIKFEPTQKSECNDLCNKLNSSDTIVKSVSVTKKDMLPKKLFCTNKLYSEMNSKYGFKMEDVAQSAEKLYLSGFISYPRTDLEYLLESESNNMKDIIESLKSAGFPVEFQKNKSVFDDNKCGGAGEGGHTAITITTQIPSEEELAAMTKIQTIVYSSIFNRTLSNFCDRPLIEETKVVLTNNNYEFSLTGNKLLKQGFLVFESRAIKDELPKFEENEKVDSKFVVAERETTPPTKVTVKQLLEYLSNPFKDQLKSKNARDDEEYYKIIKEGATIGTPDTMSQTVEKAVRYGYLDAGKKNLTTTEKGKALIDLLDELQINLFADKTIEMNKSLRKVGNGLMTLQQNKANIEAELNSNIDANMTTVINVNVSDKKEIVGKCPKCGSNVIESKYGFCCSNYPNCKFGIYTKNKYFEAMGKKINKSIAKSFLEKGSAVIKGCKSTKKDENGKPKTYDCIINVDFSGQYPKFSREFINKKKGKD